MVSRAHFLIELLFWSSHASLIPSTEGGLRMTESISFRCSLEEKSEESTKKMSMATDPAQFVRNRLSILPIKRIPDAEKLVPNTANVGSFLMKHETKYIGIIGQLGNSEEFNNIVSTIDRHMTIALTWKANVCDNSSVQRIAYGQHFVQLRNLYETYATDFVECCRLAKLIEIIFTAS